MVEQRDASDSAVMSNAGRLMHEEEEMNIIRDELGNPTGRDRENMNPHSRRTRRTGVRSVRSCGSHHPDDDTLSYRSDSSHGSRKSARNLNDQDGRKSVQNQDQDSGELLRRIEELEKQLRHSGNIGEKSKAPIDSFEAQFYSKYVPSPQYVHHYSEPFPHSSGPEMRMSGLHQSPSNPYGVHTHRRFPHHSPVQYPHQSPHPYFSGPYVDNIHAPFDQYPPNANGHWPSCPCFHCYEMLQQSPAHAPRNTRFGDVRYSPPSYQFEHINQHNRNFQASVPPSVNSYGPPQAHHMRWPSDVDSEISGFAHRSSPKVIPASSAHHFRSVAGGAPFFTCHNCFELLLVPQKVKLVLPQQQKVRCGACSALTSFSVVNKKLVLSLDADVKPVSDQTDDGSSAVVRDTASHSYGHANRLSTNFSSEDYDHSGYDLHAMDREDQTMENNQGLNSSKSQEAHNFHSSPSGGFKDENDSCRINSHPTKGNVTRHQHAASLQELFEHSTANREVLRSGMEYLNFRTESENMELKVEAPKHDALKDSSMVTETDLSFNASTNTEASQDVREDDRPEADKVGGLSFDTVEESSESDTEDNTQSRVSVNGHQIRKRLVRAAEKMAGKIQPGNYWYDYRAGFWGVMGGPCLGIILPFIEEFNHPMLENCAAGNTRVFVNRRELHRKDLDLLTSRGLPTEKDRHYIIDISGRVLDGETGEELDSLGKLAPTVEKMKRGFGMKLPRVRTQSLSSHEPVTGEPLKSHQV